MRRTEKVIHALKMINERFFVDKDLEADWARLFTLWLFEYNQESKDDSMLCQAQGKMLSMFLNAKNIKNVPEFKKCNTESIGVWTKYKGTIYSKGTALLLFEKNSPYMRDIMNRKPYKYGKKG